MCGHWRPRCAAPGCPERPGRVHPRPLPGDFGLVWYGQHEADWVGYFDLHQRVLGTTFGPRDRQQLALWATLARSCGWWWPREGLCVLAERPCAIRTEPVPDSTGGEVRPHARDRPAIAFPDGWAVHAWHGRPVPAWVIEAPAAERIAAERNVEIRRCALEQGVRRPSGSHPRRRGGGPR